MGKWSLMSQCWVLFYLRFCFVLCRSSAVMRIEAVEPKQAIQCLNGVGWIVIVSVFLRCRFDDNGMLRFDVEGDENGQDKRPKSNPGRPTLAAAGDGHSSIICFVWSRFFLCSSREKLTDNLKTGQSVQLLWRQRPRYSAGVLLSWNEISAIILWNHRCFSTVSNFIARQWPIFVLMLQNILPVEGLGVKLSEYIEIFKIVYPSRTIIELNALK